MIQKLSAPASTATAADLTARFGPITLDRIRFDPRPGTATENDVLDIQQREKRLYELVDGILVEKAMGYAESFLAADLLRLLGNFVAERDLGAVTGADGMMRLAPGLVRIPDVSFVPWDAFPNRQIPNDPIPDLAPLLAIEVLSLSNTVTEMENKVGDYFQSGAKLVWLVNPRTRTIEVFTDPNRSAILTADQTIDGGTVLPGFTLRLSQLFGKLDPH